MANLGYKELSLLDEWPYKKYKDMDMTVGDVIEEDIDYVTWCLENIDGFVLSPDAMDAYEWMVNDRYVDEFGDPDNFGYDIYDHY